MNRPQVSANKVPKAGRERIADPTVAVLMIVAAVQDCGVRSCTVRIDVDLQHPPACVATRRS
jgi:hypothetical protein